MNFFNSLKQGIQQKASQYKESLWTYLEEEKRQLEEEQRKLRQLNQEGNCYTLKNYI